MEQTEIGNPVATKRSITGGGSQEFLGRQIFNGNRAPDDLGDEAIIDVRFHRLGAGDIDGAPHCPWICCDPQNGLHKIIDQERLLPEFAAGDKAQRDSAIELAQ